MPTLQIQQKQWTFYHVVSTYNMLRHTCRTYQNLISPVGIILSTGQGELKQIKECVASETGESKRNTHISSGVSGQSVTSQFLFVDSFYKTKFPLNQTFHKTFIVLCMLVIHQVSVEQYLQNQTVVLSGRIPVFY